MPTLTKSKKESGQGDAGKSVKWTDQYFCPVAGVKNSVDFKLSCGCAIVLSTANEFSLNPRLMY